jgi:hypothetical protein
MNNLIVGERKLKITRTTEHTDTVIMASGYTTDKLSLSGIMFKLKNLPYPIRMITKDPAFLYVGCKVKFTGTMQKYKDAEYFRANDIEIVEQSPISKLATSGVSYSGAL